MADEFYLEHATHIIMRYSRNMYDVYLLDINSYKNRWIGRIHNNLMYQNEMAQNRKLGSAPIVHKLHFVFRVQVKQLLPISVECLFSTCHSSG